MGNVTFSTPFSIFALTSSGYGILVRRGGNCKHNIHDAHLGTLGECQRAREIAPGPLADGVSALITFLAGAGLARDREEVLVDLYVNLLGLDAGQVPRRGDRVCLVVLVYVDPASIDVSQGRWANGGQGLLTTYLGWKGPGRVSVAGLESGREYRGDRDASSKRQSSQKG